MLCRRRRPPSLADDAVRLHESEQPLQQADSNHGQSAIDRDLASSERETRASPNDGASDRPKLGLPDALHETSQKRGVSDRNVLLH